MSTEKAALRGWTRAQTRLGKAAARPVVCYGLLSSLTGIGQIWCVATILGHALAGWRTGAAIGAFPVWPFVLFPALALTRALLTIRMDIGAARAGITARRRLRASVLASVLTGGPALLRRGSKVATPTRGAAKKLSYKDQYALDRLPEEMAQLEKRIVDLREKLQDSTLYGRDPARFEQYTAKLQAAEAELAACEERWLELEMKREALQAD